jgi:hypothetical protein
VSAWFLALLVLLYAPLCTEPGDPVRSIAPRAAQDPDFDQTHAGWSALLARHLQDGRFDYKALSEARGDLDLYLLALGGVRREQFDTWTREQKYAFWINAYNAFTVHLVLTRYPVGSIKDIGSLVAPVWKKRFIPLGHLALEDSQDPISLDTIEHEVLRPRFEDARVHAAINCASESCPPLAATAYTAEQLEQQLDTAVRNWLADPTLNRFDGEQRRLEVSAIFDWFESDFERDAGSVRAWIARYAPEQEARWLAEEGKVEIDYLPYSWKLNDTQAQAR